jgi:hypothetical protein
MPAHPQRIVCLMRRNEVLRTHTQRLGTRSGCKRGETRSMWIMTLDTPSQRPLPFCLIPISIRPPVRTVLPITIDRSMTLAAQLGWPVPRDFPPIVVNKCIPIRGMVTIETSCIDAMFQLDFRVLSQRASRLKGRIDDLVTLAAAIREDPGPILGQQMRLSHGSRIDRRIWHRRRIGNNARVGERVEHQHDRAGEQRSWHPIVPRARSRRLRIVCHASDAPAYGGRRASPEDSGSRMTQSITEDAATLTSKRLAAVRPY